MKKILLIALALTLSARASIPQMRTAGCEHLEDQSKCEVE